MMAFENLIGYKRIKEQFWQVADMITNKEKYDKLGATLPKGLILYGPPGVGKTMMAMALIDTVGIPYAVIRHNVDHTTFLQHIKDRFAEMAKHPQAIILLDDLDKYTLEEDSKEAFSVVQACIDEVKHKNIFVLATANNLRSMPASLLRSGRFDKKIKMDYPDGQDAVDIITHYMRNTPTALGINYEDIAKMLYGKSCATLARVINEAAIDAAYSGKKSLK